MSGVAYYHRPLKSYMIGRRRPWHVIIALRHHTRSNYIVQGMPSSPLGNTHGQAISRVASFHHPWNSYTIGRPRAWYVIIDLEEHTLLDHVGNGVPHVPWVLHTVE